MKLNVELIRKLISVDFCRNIRDILNIEKNGTNKSRMLYIKKCRRSIDGTDKLKNAGNLVYRRAIDSYAGYDPYSFHVNNPPLSEFREG